MSEYVYKHAIRLALFLISFFLFAGFILFNEVNNPYVDSFFEGGPSTLFALYLMAFGTPLAVIRWWRSVRYFSDDDNWHFLPIWSLIILHVGALSFLYTTQLPEFEKDKFVELEQKLMIFSKIKNSMELTDVEVSFITDDIVENYPTSPYGKYNAFASLDGEYRVYSKRALYEDLIGKRIKLNGQVSELAIDYVKRRPVNLSSEQKKQLKDKLENKLVAYADYQQYKVERGFLAAIKKGKFVDPFKFYNFGKYVDDTQTDTQLLAFITNKSTETVVVDFERNISSLATTYRAKVYENLEEWQAKAAANNKRNSMSPMEKAGSFAGSISKALGEAKDEIVEKPLKEFKDAYQKAKE